MRMTFLRLSRLHRPELPTRPLGFVLAALVVAAQGCSSSSSPPGSTTGATGQSGADSTAGSTGLGGPSAGTAGVSTGSFTGSPSTGASGTPASTGNGAGSGVAASPPSDDAGAGLSGSSGSAVSGGGAGAAGSSTVAPDSGASGSQAGSSGSSAGPVDAGTVSGGDGAVAAEGCAGKSYKFCEDFETGTVGSFPTGWTAFKGYGAGSATDVALASDEFHSGKMSLKSDSLMRGATRAQRSLSAIGATAANHWGRIFYKVDSPSPKPNTYLHNTFVSLVGPGGENRIVDTVEAPNGTHQWLFNIPSDGCCTSSAYSWTFDAAWHCAEWYVDVAANSYRFFSDSTEVTSLAFTGNTKSTMSDYTSVVVGATYYQANGAIATPFIVWFDDLAIDDNRINCQ